jgi:hypothetical protein
MIESFLYLTKGETGIEVNFLSEKRNLTSRICLNPLLCYHSVNFDFIIEDLNNNYFSLQSYQRFKICTTT